MYKTLIEGVELSVCSGCSKFGKVLAHVKSHAAIEPIRKQAKEEKIELLVENYAEIIRKRRESLGLTQRDFAGKINEKEATIHKIETKALEPSLALAKKLEKALGVKLVEEHEEKPKPFKKRSIESFTLGDFIKIKK